jgi:hypothetical protein
MKIPPPPIPSPSEGGGWGGGDKFIFKVIPITQIPKKSVWSFEIGIWSLFGLPVAGRDLGFVIWVLDAISHALCVMCFNGKTLEGGEKCLKGFF